MSASYKVDTRPLILGVIAIAVILIVPSMTNFFNHQTEGNETDVDGYNVSWVNGTGHGGPWMPDHMKKDPFIVYSETPQEGWPTAKVSWGSVKVENSSSPFMEHYYLAGLNTTFNASQYELPLNLSRVSNIESFSETIQLSAEAREMLMEKGFVVVEEVNGSRWDDMVSPYLRFRRRGVPVYVTTDSLLHIYHVLFDETLSGIEEDVFYHDIGNMSKSLLGIMEQGYNESKGELKEAYRRNTAYLAVGLSLMGEDIEIPDYVEMMVSLELALIKEHQGFHESPVFLYSEDYSQYVPRGHYTKSERLKSFFKAMMWYGRITMLLKGNPVIPPGQSRNSEEGYISSYDARVQTMQACLISAALMENSTLMSHWDRVYTVTSFFVGVSDDLGPYEYIDAMNEVFNGDYEVSKLTEENIESIKESLMENLPPRIYGGTGKVVLEDITEGSRDEALTTSMGFRLMGQRFTPDSYLMQRLIFPAVQSPIDGGGEFTLTATAVGLKRGFPRGLDLMAVLGSRRAREILDEYGDSSYENYDDEFDEVMEEFNGYGEEDWSQTLYWAWMRTLKTLTGSYGTGYPTYMQSNEYEDKMLTTALASWAELRHDTILYVKQLYGVEAMGMTVYQEKVGYVEPVPEFYGRLYALTRMTRHGLKDFGVLDKKMTWRFETLEEMLQNLQRISVKELQNEPLTEKEINLIRNIGDKLEDITADMKEDSLKTSMVADIFTDPNSMTVVEEATGNVRIMIVAYRLPDDRVLLGAGPVMTYYEFKQPMSQRLTDEKWREILKDNPPADPKWVNNFTVK